jgi:hypothetical protein
MSPRSTIVCRGLVDSGPSPQEEKGVCLSRVVKSLAAAGLAAFGSYFTELPTQSIRKLWYEDEAVRCI